MAFVNLAQIRKKEGYSQLELARKVGLSQVMVSFLETGRKDVNTTTAWRIAQALNCTIDDLMTINSSHSNDGLLS